MPGVPRARSEIVDFFRASALEVAKLALPDVDEQTRLADLGVDSVALVEIVTAVERRASVVIDDAALVRIRAVGDLVEEVLRAEARREALP